MEVDWPEVFINPDFEYPNDESAKPHAVGDGLSGWACCVLEVPPPHFGKGLVKIGDVTGCGATPEALEMLADELSFAKKSQNRLES